MNDEGVIIISANSENGKADSAKDKPKAKAKSQIDPKLNGAAIAKKTPAKATKAADKDAAAKPAKAAAAKEAKPAAKAADAKEGGAAKKAAAEKPAKAAEAKEPKPATKAKASEPAKSDTAAKAEKGKPSSTKKAAVTAAKAQTAADQAGRQVVFDSNEDRFSVAEQAMLDPEVLKMLIDNLAGAERRMRQFSAGAIAVVSERQPELLAPYIPQIADALHRPEAQTRWESLEALARVVTFDPEAADEAILGAEASLYDEENGPARLGAVRFLAAYGAIDAKRSIKVWPYIDEAIQVYHGDPEFQDMLIAVIGFASGRPAKQVREALAERMRFDAENAKGPLQRRAEQIVELCKGK